MPLLPTGKSTVNAAVTDEVLLSSHLNNLLNGSGKMMREAGKSLIVRFFWL